MLFIIEVSCLLFFITAAEAWKWWHRVEKLNLTTRWIVVWL